MDDAAPIATHYQLDAASPAPVAFGGLRAFPVIDRRDPGRALLALEARPDMPPRPRFLQAARAQLQVPHSLMPLDHGHGRTPAGEPAWFMMCAAPPGARLTTTPTPMGETEVLRCLLLPAASALVALADLGVTSRAIRPDNIFRAGPREPVTLGPCWSTPAASQQPAAFEPPYSATCLPAGRGDGGIADDVYALGVTMLWCVLGGAVDWADGPVLTQRKLEQGSFAALVGGARLTSLLQDLLSVMLAEDPDHRPAPSLLLEPTQARSRRLATRPPQRAARALQVGDIAAWSARELAAALARAPEKAAGLIKSGAVDRWLRRVLGDSALAIELEEAAERRAAETGDEARMQALLVMRTVAALDPFAPLAWRGIVLFPDGLGPLLAAAQGPSLSAMAAGLEELVSQDVITQWCDCQTKRRDIPGLKQDAREWRGWLGARGPMGGSRRLLYGLNPYLRCASPLLNGVMAARIADLLVALDGIATRGTPPPDRKRAPFDGHIAAFVAARADQKLFAEFTRLEGLTAPGEPAVLAFYACLQINMSPGPLPGLAAWLLDSGTIDLTAWCNLATRERMGRDLAARAAAGQIAAMMLLAEDPLARGADRAAAAHAGARLSAIEAERASIASGGAKRAEAARRVGEDIAFGAATLAALGAALMLALTL